QPTASRRQPDVLMARKADIRLATRSAHQPHPAHRRPSLDATVPLLSHRSHFDYGSQLIAAQSRPMNFTSYRQGFDDPCRGLAGARGVDVLQVKTVAQKNPLRPTTRDGRSITQWASLLWKCFQSYGHRRCNAPPTPSESIREGSRMPRAALHTERQRSANTPYQRRSGALPPRCRTTAVLI